MPANTFMFVDGILKGHGMHNKNAKMQNQSLTNCLIEPNNRMQIMNETLTGSEKKCVALSYVALFFFLSVEVCNPFFSISIRYLFSAISSLIHSIFPLLTVRCTVRIVCNTNFVHVKPYASKQDAANSQAASFGEFNH